MVGSKYVDLGAIPTAVEYRTATHMQVDEPPPMDTTADAIPPQGNQVWHLVPRVDNALAKNQNCLLYTSDAADE